MYLRLNAQVTEFQKPHYLANFVQSTFNALPEDKVKGECAHTIPSIISHLSL